MSITVRPALLADIPLLIKARFDFLEALGHPVGEPLVQQVRNQIESFLTEHLNKQIFAFIAMDGETIAAAGFLQLFSVMAHFSAPSGNYGRVTNMLTWPAYRSQGLARQIMNALIAKALEFDLDYINLDASDMGRPLYEDLGFVDFVPEDPPMVLSLRKTFKAF